VGDKLTGIIVAYRSSQVLLPKPFARCAARPSPDVPGSIPQQQYEGYQADQEREKVEKTDLIGDRQVRRATAR
jgi:hypothetical protein